MRRCRGRLAVAVLLVGLSVGASGCGGGHHSRRGKATATSGRPGGASRPAALTVYASLPLRGPESRRALAVLSGMELAWEQAGRRAGAFRIAFNPRDDASAHGANPVLAAGNARRAAADPRAILYLGELDAATSEVSIPILNQAGLPQIGPTSGYVGLTRAGPGSAPGEPGHLYPLGVRTFVRIVPRDSVQAAAALSALHHDGCTKVAVSTDGGVAANGLLALLQAGHGRYGVGVMPVAAPAGHPGAGALTAMVGAITHARTPCVMLAGSPGPAMVRLASALPDAIAHLRLFASDTLCTTSFTEALPGSLAPLFRCLAATPGLSATATGRAFLTAVRHRYDLGTPDPAMALGYAAMRLGLSTISALGRDGASRESVLSALLATREGSSLLGPFAILSGGDSTLDTYSLYRLGRDGRPLFLRSITS